MEYSTTYTKTQQHRADYISSHLNSGNSWVSRDSTMEELEALRELGLCYRHDDEEFPESKNMEDKVVYYFPKHQSE